MSYVPPHLRKKAAGATSPASTAAEDDVFTLEEIHDYFWNAADAHSDRDSRFSSVVPLSKTLHDSRETPGRLAFVILFEGAKPRWDAEHIVFTKSNL